MSRGSCPPPVPHRLYNYVTVQIHEGRYAALAQRRHPVLQLLRDPLTRQRAWGLATWLEYAFALPSYLLLPGSTAAHLLKTSILNGG